MYNEWALLVIEQQIEPGDTLELLDEITGQKMPVVFVSTKKSRPILNHDDLIRVIDHKCHEYLFEMDDLCQYNRKSKQRWVITGMAKEPLTIHRKRRLSKKGGSEQAKT
jgi:hypothetical protein